MIYLPPSGGEPSTIGVVERDGALVTLMLEVPGTYSYKRNKTNQTLTKSVSIIMDKKCDQICEKGLVLHPIF